MSQTVGSSSRAYFSITPIFGYKFQRFNFLRSCTLVNVYIIVFWLASHSRDINTADTNFRPTGLQGRATSHQVMGPD